VGFESDVDGEALAVLVFVEGTGVGDSFVDD